MECNEAKTQLTGLVSGRLDESTAAEVEAHLETCEECSLEVELLRGRNAPAPAAERTNDWTVEKIFGSEDPGSKSAPSAGAGSAGPDPEESTLEVSRTDSPLFASEDLDTAPSREGMKGAPPSAVVGADAPPPPPPAPPAPTERPSMILPPPGTKKTSAENWDFEPADAARESAPPEESLAFAEQALQRRNDGSGKQSAAMRATLWTASAVAGVALLGVSIWMALAVQQAPNQVVSTKSPRPDSGDRRPRPAVGSGDSTGVGSSWSEEAIPPAPVPAPDESGSRASASAPPSAGAVAPTPTPIKSNLAGSTRLVTPGPVSTSPSPPSKSSPGKPATTKPGGSATATAPSQVATTAPAPAPTGVATVKAPVVPAKDETVATSTKATVPPRLPRDDEDMWPTDVPVRHAPAPSKSVPPPVPPGDAAVEKSPATGTTTEKPVPVPDTASPGVAPTPASLKPLDRLHAATVTATQNDDLDGLRRLKTAWRNTLRTAVGPNRARARRELADCLWAIQALTGRETDQREALLAYRDYLLNAPAGGTDTQGAERLRELEDTLRER